MLVLVGILAVGLPVVLLAQTPTTNTLSTLVSGNVENTCDVLLVNPSANSTLTTPTVATLASAITCLQAKITSLESRIKVLESGTIPLKTCPAGCTCYGNGPDSTISCPVTSNGDINTKTNTTANTNISPSETKAIQQFLNVKSDGILGPKTKAAINNFQATQGLTTTGMIDQVTLEKMKALAPTVAPSINTSLQQVQVEQ